VLDHNEHKKISLTAECVKGHHLDFDLIEAESQLSSNAFSQTWKGTYGEKKVAIKMVC